MTIINTPVPPLRPGALKSMDEKLASLPKNTDIMLLGDSMVDNWDEFLSTSFPGRAIWNFGVGGDLIQNTEWRFDRLDKKAVAPKSVVLIVGTNNFAASFTPACSIAYGIEHLALLVTDAWPEASVFIVGILPRGADFQYRAADRRIINADLQEFSIGRKNLAFVPVDEITITCGKIEGGPLDEREVACAPSTAYTCSNYNADHLHLTGGGYSVLREALSSASIQRFGKDVLR